jgi:hypothetical protein
LGKFCDIKKFPVLNPVVCLVAARIFGLVNCLTPLGNGFQKTPGTVLELSAIPIHHGPWPVNPQQQEC